MTIATAGSRPITVAIPAYNCAATVQRAIDSILAQTYVHFELLVVDDGSTDATPAILARQRDPRIRIVSHRYNRGEGAARNTCFREARHAWLAFLDADDEWFPDKLRLQAEALAAQAGDSFALFVPYQRCNLDNGSRETICETAEKEGGDWTRHLLDQCGIGAGTTMLTTKAAFALAGPYDERLVRRTDHDWLLRFAVAGGQLVQLGGAAQARVYFTAKSRPEAIAGATEIFLDKHRPLYAAHPRRIANRAQATLLFQIAESCELAGRTLAAFGIVCRCLPLDPARALPEIARHLDRLVGRPVSRLRRTLRARRPGA